MTADIPMTRVTIHYEADEFRSFGGSVTQNPLELAWTALDRLDDDNQHVNREHRRKPISVTIAGTTYTVAEIEAWHRAEAARAAEARRVRAEEANRAKLAQLAAEQAARAANPAKVYRVTTRAARLLRKN